MIDIYNNLIRLCKYTNWFWNDQLKINVSFRLLGFWGLISS